MCALLLCDNYACMRVCFVCLCVCVCDNVVHTICVTNYQAVPGHHVDHGERRRTLCFFPIMLICWILVGRLNQNLEKCSLPLLILLLLPLQQQTCIRIRYHNIDIWYSYTQTHTHTHPNTLDTWIIFYCVYILSCIYICLLGEVTSCEQPIISSMTSHVHNSK